MFLSLKIISILLVNVVNSLANLTFDSKNFTFNSCLVLLCSSSVVSYRFIILCLGSTINLRISCIPNLIAKNVFEPSLASSVFESIFVVIFIEHVSVDNIIFVITLKILALRPLFGVQFHW